MILVIAGDMIGSKYEFNNISNEDFGPLFVDRSTYTDDTVLSVAGADQILNGGGYAENFLAYAQNYENRGYGGNFGAMVRKGKLEPYDSYGNGSAMRVSPVGWIVPLEDGRENVSWITAGFRETMLEAKKSAECTHSHEEGIKGAQAAAGAMFLARCGMSKEKILEVIAKLGYDLSKKSYDFRQGKFDVSCQGTIPRVMSVYAETDNFESAMRKMVAMGGDVDTNCAILGGICEATYGIPEGIAEEVYLRLPRDMADIVTAFYKKYIDNDFKEPDVKVGSMTATFEDQLSSLFSSGSGNV